jgi:prevent-host-death family protein
MVPLVEEVELCLTGTRAAAIVTRIMVMAEVLPLARVKARLSEIVDRVFREQERVVVTRNGRPAAVLISPDDLESLEETLAILSDAELMAQFREGERAIERGEVVSLEELRRRYGQKPPRGA